MCPCTYLQRVTSVLVTGLWSSILTFRRIHDLSSVLLPLVGPKIINVLYLSDCMDIKKWINNMENRCYRCTYVHVFRAGHWRKINTCSCIGITHRLTRILRRISVYSQTYINTYIKDNRLSFILQAMNMLCTTLSGTACQRDLKNTDCAVSWWPSYCKGSGKQTRHSCQGRAGPRNAWKD